MSVSVRIGILLTLVTLVAAPPATAQDAAPKLNAGVQSPFAVVAERVMPAVVSITANKTFSHPDVSPDSDLFRFFPRERGLRRDMEMPGAGSGFVVSADGYVLTNNHVIADANSVEVLLPGAREALDAEIIGQDPSTDLALLKIDPKGQKLSPLVFADSDAVKVGDWAIAIGNPLGQLAGSLTVGVISAKGRSDLNIQGGAPRYQDFLQTDAAINFGNSGGPLVDIHGRVIGVNTAINATGQNIGFTIPSNLAMKVYTQLRAKGRVVRGYLGVRMTTLSREMAEGRDLGVRSGVMVDDVVGDSPASRAGLRPGDVITAFNGEAITDSRDLQFKVADAPVGERARIEIHREGRTQQLEVVLAELTENALAATPSPRGDAPAADGESWLGITVASLADRADPRVDELVETYGIADREGVVVVAVEPGSPADRARLRPGDVIVEIVNSSVATLEDFREAARRYRERTKQIAVLVRRGEMSSFVTIDPLSE